MSDFISPRRRPRRKAWQPSGNTSSVRIMLARRTTMCGVCNKFIVKGKDMCGLVFESQEWVHAGACLAKASGQPEAD